MVLKAIKEAEKTALPPKYSGECFLNVKKKSYPTVQSAYGGDFQERSEKKKKNPTVQPFRSITVMQEEKPSYILFLIVKCCRQDLGVGWKLGKRKKGGEGFPV